MKLIQICPQCGLPGIKVDKKAVINNLKKTKRTGIDMKMKWNICSNPECTGSYFSGGTAFSTSDLTKPIFYKNNSDKVPICYCAGLTRGEIKDAVRHGCKSVKEVHKYTGKNGSGHCDERNPLGKCCRNVFVKTIEETK